MWVFGGCFSFIVSHLIQKELIGCLLLGLTWEHPQSKTIKTKEQTQRLGDLNHGSWQGYSIQRISSAGNLTEAWCRNGLGLTLVFCLYCKAKVWLLPSTLEKYPAPCYQQIFQGGSVRHPLDVHSRLQCRKRQIFGMDCIMNILIRGVSSAGKTYHLPFVFFLF